MTLSLGYLPPVYVSRRNYSDEFDARDSGWKGDGFAAAGGAATITPSEGSERSFNGDLESWASPTNANSFTEVAGGSSSVNQEATTKHGGSYAARLDVDSSNTLINLTQTINGTTGEWTLARFWLRASAAGKTGSLASSAAGYGEAPARNPGTDWTEYLQNGRYTADGGQYQWGRVSAASASLYLDDLSIKPLTLATMFAVRRSTTSDVQVAAGWTVEPGTWSGVVACLDDPDDPQNFILGITNGAYAKLVKCVGGVYTELVNEAVDYGSNLGIEVWKVGGAVRLIYGAVQVGSDQTISDAGIVDNVYHGLFSGYGGNAARDFTYQEVNVVLNLALLLPVYPTLAAPALIAPANSAQLSDDTPEFSWAVVTGATQYQIQISTDANFATTVQDITQEELTYTPPALDRGAGYYWRVRAMSGDAGGIWSSAYNLYLHTYATCMTYLDMDVWLRLQEPSGATAVNSGNLGAAADGAITAVTLAQAGKLGAGEAGDFNGTTSKITIPANAAFNLNTAWTYGILIKPDSAGETSVGAFWTYDQAVNFDGRFAGSLDVIRSSWGTGATYSQSDTTTGLDAGVWAWVFFVLDSAIDKKIRIYTGIAGVLAEKAYSVFGGNGVAPDLSAQVLVVGNRSTNNRTTDGLADEFFVKGRALSVAELQLITELTEVA